MRRRVDDLAPRETDVRRRETDLSRREELLTQLCAERDVHFERRDADLREREAALQNMDEDANCRPISFLKAHKKVIAQFLLFLTFLGILIIMVLELASIKDKMDEASLGIYPENLGEI